MISGENDLPLDGVQVVDLTTMAAAPICSAALADWGADVIKIESIGGDFMRIFGLIMACPIADDDNVQFEIGNRNKRGISVNLKSVPGMKILHTLLESADVMVTNYRPDALKRLGIDYDSISVKYPRLVYAYLNGYGDRGPDKDKPGYDLSSYFARSGILIEFGEPGTEPIPAVAGFGDHTTGTFLAGGICAALLARERTGRGIKVQTSLYGSAIWNLALNIASANNTGGFLRQSRCKPRNGLMNTYRTKNGRWITIMAIEYDRYWKSFCQQVILKPELADDPRFSTQSASFGHSEELAAIIGNEFEKYTDEDLIARLKKADIAYEINQRWHELKYDAQALENGFLMEYTMPSGRTEWVPGNPVKFNGEMTRIRRRAPRIGEHTLDVLKEMGYSDADIIGMKESGVIR
jgi:crotonobetainyl-CoA:carnitine CoA-transferase CaiB-like acyl-CoA transferase